MLDLRIPTGLFFAVTGLVLTGMGVFSPDTRAVLTAANVNLYSGITMLLFGSLLLILTRTNP